MMLSRYLLGLDANSKISLGSEITSGFPATSHQGGKRERGEGKRGERGEGKRGERREREREYPAPVSGSYICWLLLHHVG